MNNGDIQRLNQFGNAFARETGDPAPTNFNAIRSAVSGELSKTFKGTGATDQEISEINQGINSAESPEQLHGAINYYTRLMDGKISAMRAQYEAGKQGRPAFPENVPAGSAAPSGGARPGAAPRTGAAAPQTGLATVVAPDGNIYTFPNQKAADQFKKAAGIP